MRCKMRVVDELQKLGLHVRILHLRIVELEGDIRLEQRMNLKTNLQNSGLELMDDEKSILVKWIKNIIIQMVHYTDEHIKVNNSEFISGKLSYVHPYLANILLR